MDSKIPPTAHRGDFSWASVAVRTNALTTSGRSTKSHTMLRQQQPNSRMRNPAWNSPPLRARFGGWQQEKYSMIPWAVLCEKGKNVYWNKQKLSTGQGEFSPCLFFYEKIVENVKNRKDYPPPRRI